MQTQHPEPVVVRAPRAAAFAVAGLLASCSVADNLSFGELVTELDGIVTITGEGEDRGIAYAEDVEVAAWYMRQFWLWPIRWALGPVFGYREHDLLQNPAGHVRDLLLELPDEVGSDTLRCAQATTRLGWIAEVDRNGLSRVVGIDGLVAVAGHAGLALFARSFDELGQPLPQPTLDAARTVIAGGRPDARDAAFPPAARADYVAALAQLCERPLAHWTDRLLLVEDLVVLARGETDPELLAATERALRTAMAHCIEGVLLRAVEDRDRRFVEVRLCAMEQIRRLAGPRGVPLLLAVMSATPAQRARLEPQFDPDPLVQLRLIHYCGQLRGANATAEVRLPGRESWQAIAPVDFLAQAVLNGLDAETSYSTLRTPALAALALSLGRPTLDPDPSWVGEWYRERHSRGLRTDG